MHIGGTLKHRTASADTSDVAAAGGAAAALGAVVNPLLALIPLIHMGDEDEDVCRRTIALVGRPGTGERH